MEFRWQWAPVGGYFCPPQLFTISVTQIKYFSPKYTILKVKLFGYPLFNNFPSALKHILPNKESSVKEREQSRVPMSIALFL